jgi:integrase
MPGNVVRVRGIKRYFEPKAGKYYCYHRATGKRIEEEFGSLAFFARLSALEEEVQRRAEVQAKPNTLKALILSYKASDGFAGLAPRTRSDYEKVFAFLAPVWDGQVSAFTTPQIVVLRDKWRKERGRCFINKTLAVVSIIFAHGVERGLLNTNPVRDVKQIRRPKDAPAVNRPWTIAERKAAMAHLPVHLKLPFTIGLYSGMREGDVIRAPRSIISASSIKIKTAKRGVWIDIPILPELKAALEAAPAHDAITLCVNSRGKPWTLQGFSCSFRKAIKQLEEAGLVGDGLTFHGLRHTVATTLAESGVGEEDIAAVLGHKTSRMAAHYAREADRAQRTKAAIKRFEPLGREHKGDKSV